MIPKQQHVVQVTCESFPSKVASHSQNVVSLSETDLVGHKRRWEQLSQRTVATSHQNIGLPVSRQSWLAETSLWLGSCPARFMWTSQSDSRFPPPQKKKTWLALTKLGHKMAASNPNLRLPVSPFPPFVGLVMMEMPLKCRGTQSAFWGGGGRTFFFFPNNPVGSN